MKKNPFNENELEDAFHKFVWDTPLSNMDLSIVEDPNLEDGVVLLDAIESFGDGESVPERVPFDKDLTCSSSPENFSPGKNIIHNVCT